MITGNFFFDIMAVIVVGTAVGMLTSQNAVYSALFLVLNFASVALLYITLGAPFIAMIQVTVYAGAIMVLFLFVIMLLGAERLKGEGTLRGERLLALILGVAFLGEAAWLLIFQSGVPSTPLTLLSSDFAGPKQIGLLLYKDYLLPFEVASTILLVALVGAIFLAKKEKTTRESNPEVKE